MSESTASSRDPAVKPQDDKPLLLSRVALVLAGCGAKDGSEITEAVSLLVAFAQAKFKVSLFAPDRNCFHVVNHLNGEVVQTESRNMLIEAARIARGKISPLSALKADDFDVLCFAGGFGVAKNLCDFAISGKDALLMEDVERVLFDFIRAQKVVSALCIAPVLLAIAAKKLKLLNVRLTVGLSSSEAAQAMTSWGIHHEERKVSKACIDTKNKFVTAPAYMYDSATPADIFASASALVKGVERLCSEF